MRIGVTISRDWDDYEAIYQALDDAVPEGLAAHQEGWARVPVTVIHGASQMDWFIAGVAFSFGLQLEAHPADWSTMRGGVLRNQEMVDAGADVWLVFNKGHSRGASDCEKRARKAGIPVRRYER